MIKIVQSDLFKRWLAGLRDRQARARIHANGVSEARIDYGPGYRLYFICRGTTVIVMLGGGDKSSQARDIKRARELVEQWR